MFPARIEPAIAAGEPQQTYALNRVVTGVGSYFQIINKCSAVVQVIRETDSQKQD
jgi:hypothetical protein